MNIEIKKPILKDIPKMQELVRPEVESGIILDRTDSEIANAIRSYFVAIEIDGQEIVGFCSLHIHTIELAEIRSLVVDSNYRGKGIGKKLVQEAINEAIFYGLKEILVLTYQKEFFEKLGFIEIPKEKIPDSKIWADCIRCKHFPICNELSLIKKL